MQLEICNFFYIRFLFFFGGRSAFYVADNSDVIFLFYAVFFEFGPISVKDP
jgi:hypothetical protein